ncbi:putative 4-hydroxybenzoate polyprenyl transferase [Xylaria palmicola]|nr:putative 4-hydroxybenzoate polyprenyl transferase [Xylaria palmicola]
MSRNTSASTIPATRPKPPGPHLRQRRQDERVNFFPQLPLYSHPNEGLLGVLPRALVPYAQLMRLEKPAGLYAVYFPYLIGLIYAACITPERPEPLQVGQLAVALLAFSVFLRGAACSWNDTLHQKFDRQVVRCRHRPVARGAISTRQAHAFTLALLALGLYPVLNVMFPVDCTPQAAIIVALTGLYALMKRVTAYPQIVLGITLSWGVFFSVAALGSQAHSLRVGGRDFAATLALFGSNVAWAVTNDVFYACQDVKDDEKIDIGSMALRFKNNIKLLAGVLTLAQVALLALCGILAGFGPIFFVGSVAWVAIAMMYYVQSVDLDSPES